MDPMPEPLTSFKQYVEADLRRAARLIIAVQDEIDPQFRIATPEGDYAIALTLPDDLRERMQMMKRVSTFMDGSNRRRSFLRASSSSRTVCMRSGSVSHREVHMATSLIRRTPRPWTKDNFGPIHWHDRSAVGQEVIDTLPRGARSIGATELAMLEKWFGMNGRFPAVHLPSKQVRGVK